MFALAPALLLLLVEGTGAICSPGTYDDGNGSCVACTPVANAASVTCTSATDSHAVCRRGFFLVPAAAGGQADSCSQQATCGNKVNPLKKNPWSDSKKFTSSRNYCGWVYCPYPYTDYELRYVHR